MKRCAAVLISVLLTCSVASQSNIRFKNFSINEGLSQSLVSAVVQGETGFLWICTQDGLNRFDGYHFQTFSADLTSGIDNNYFNCAIEASDHKLWFGTQFGLVCYNPITELFVSYPPEGVFHSKSIKSIVEDSDGGIIVLFESGGIYLFNLNTKKYTLLNNAAAKKEYSKLFFVPKIGIVACSEKEKNISILRSSATQSLEIKGPNGELLVPKSIVPLNQWACFVGTDNGLFLWNTASNQISPFSTKFNQENPGVSIEDIEVVSEKSIFLATSEQGLYELKIVNGELLSYQQYKQDIFQKNTLLSDQTTCLFLDKKEQLWVGTQRGIGTFDPNYLGFLGVGPSGNLDLGLPSTNVWSFAESKDEQKIYVGTSAGISVYHKQSSRFTHYYRDKEKNRKEDIPALSIQVLNENKLLVGFIDGLYELRIDGASYSYTKINHSKGADKDYDRVYRILPQDETHFWLATLGGICLYNAENHSFQYVDSKNYYGSVKTIYKDMSGHVLAAPSSGGIYSCIVSSDGKIHLNPMSFNNHLAKINKGAVNCIYQHDPMVLWLGTYGKGLIKIKLDDNMIEQYDQSKGLPNNVIYGILGDDENNLWVSTNRGLSKFNATTTQAINYSEKDGLMSNEFNIGAFMLSKSGEMYFGGIYGYNHFYPYTLKNGNDNLSLFFTELRVGNKVIRANGKKGIIKSAIGYAPIIELGFNDKNIVLSFASSDLSGASQIEYRYILEGSDEDYNYIGTENSIHFSSLFPGEYTLKIYPKSSYGNWSKTPTSIRIIVLPPFWMTGWFLTILIILLLMMGYGYYRYRQEKHRRRLVRLEMKIVERTKEIRTQNEKIEKQNQKIQRQKEKVEEQKKLLESEKEKVDRLLHNILPEETANDLKTAGTTSARAYSRVSVMFTDFVGFTKIAEHMPPIDLLNRLDMYFSKFDEIIEKWNLEKIKTVGDAYLCAGGMPIRTKENPIQTVLAGLEIQQFMKEQAKTDRKNDTVPWQLRLGINTGEVVAGVVGRKRFAYDIWGATVNLAQRMEANGSAGKVNISESTYEVIEPYFECTLRGEVMTKNSGLVNMYYVDRIKPELSEDDEGIIPNERFWKIVELHIYSAINYMKAERTIMNLLEEKLPPNLHYHSIAHTKDVCAAAERFALLEGITDEDLFILKSAATYHDAGFIERYDKNEPIGVLLAQEHLPKHGYSEQQIKMVEDLIYATQIPHNPKNKLEEIICDADLDYLGRDDFHEIADKLRLELRENDKIQSDRQWDEIQVKFLTAHRYFTASAIKLRKEKKLKNLEEIKQRLLRDEYKD